GGLKGTQLGQRNVDNPANQADQICGAAGGACSGFVPSLPDASRAATFARTDVSTEDSGVTGDATPFELDSTTQSEYTSLTTASTYLRRPAETVGQQPPDTPGVEPPDQVKQQTAPATCKDLSDKAQDNSQTAARVQCD